MDGAVSTPDTLSTPDTSMRQQQQHHQQLLQPSQQQRQSQPQAQVLCPQDQQHQQWQPPPPPPQPQASPEEAAPEASPEGADPEQQQVDTRSLLELDDAVVERIAALTPDAGPLACCCRRLSAVLSSSHARASWWRQQQRLQSLQTPLAYALLAWRPLSTAAPRQLCELLLSLAPDAPQLAPRWQQHRQEALLLLERGDWVELLRLFAPHADQLLPQALAGSCHSALVEAQLADQQQRQQDKGGKRDAAWPPAHQPLPPCLRLPRGRQLLHHAALASAAAAGQAACVRALLRHAAGGAWPAELCRLEALLATAEAAAASGSAECLSEVLRAMVQQPFVSWWVQHELLASLVPSVGPAAGHGDTPTVQQVLASSHYLLVAAASSGRRAAVAAALGALPQLSIKQQLPGALIAAGRHGHLDAMRELLAHPVVSSKPLQLAAAHAGSHGWPRPTLEALLARVAAQFRPELVQLLAKPLTSALQLGRADVAGAMLSVLRAEAAVEQPELLADVLLLLAHQGDAEQVAWVLRAAPTVLVRLGQRAAAAALEGGHEPVARLILDAGGERPPAYRAAVKRGELAAAVRRRDADAVAAVLQEISLPPLWACEGGAAPAAPEPEQRAGGGAGAAQRSLAGGAPTHCLLSLLKAAACAGAPASQGLLHQLLNALAAPALSNDTLQLLVALAAFCFEEGLCPELGLVLDRAGRTRRSRARLLRALVPHLQLSADTAAPPGGGPVAAAMALLRRPEAEEVPDVLWSLVTHAYLDVAHPPEFLGVVARPARPAAFLPCRGAMAALFRELAACDSLPPGARVRDVALYKQAVRCVLGCGRADLLCAFLDLMHRHGGDVLHGRPDDLGDL